MAPAAAQAIAVSRALEAVLRQDKGRLMAALTYRLGSLQLAEDAMQEACIAALVHWGRDGPPQSPLGWMIRVAFRKALDRMRAEGRDGEREAAMQLVNELLGQEEPDLGAQISGGADLAHRLRFVHCRNRPPVS